MANETVQSIIAYEVIFKELNARSVFNKITFEKFKQILIEFNEKLKVVSSDYGLSKTIVTYNELIFTQLGNDFYRTILKPDVGKDGEPFIVTNKNNGSRVFYDDNHSAVYTQHVHCYYYHGKTFFVFHRYGYSGCKTIIMNTLNEFLKETSQHSHFEVKFINSMFDENTNEKLETLRLIQRVKKADNASNLLLPTKEIIKETVVHLKAEENKRPLQILKEFVQKITNQEDTIQQLGMIYPDFDDAKLTVKIGKSTRTINLNEFAGLLAEYDVTDRVKNPDGKLNYEFLKDVCDDYIKTILEEGVY